MRSAGLRLLTLGCFICREDANLLGRSRVHGLVGVDLYTVRKLLPRASIAMTERYTHLSRGDPKAAVERNRVTQ
jgi:hypothetical protein